MLWFPQLSTGANGQFPARRRLGRRTVLTEQPDGRVLKLADPGAVTVEWTLDLEGLTQLETNAIQTLFTACEGRLGTFTFLDPLDNLLKWSEEFSAAAWQADGSGGLRQVVQASAGLQYCLSVWAQSSSAAQITLFAEAGAAQSSRTFATGPLPRRFEHPLMLDSQAESITFGIIRASGVELISAQVDAQSGASRYKRTASRSGVYGNARFAEDVLEIMTEGPDSHSMKVRVRAAVRD